MELEPEVRAVLSRYPVRCAPEDVAALGACGGFSGARFWRLKGQDRDLCLRRWPPEHPSPERLALIHRVLLHVSRHIGDWVPAPLRTLGGDTFVDHANCLWELTPWLPGAADYWVDGRPEKLKAAMVALAQFHQASADFPEARAHQEFSPGILDRRQRLRDLLRGELRRLEASIDSAHWPEFEPIARRLIELFQRVAGRVGSVLQRASEFRVPLQPCIRDVWHDHVLFEGATVTGLIDFGAMKPDNVATDVARLLGSLTAGELAAWQVGLAAYRSIRPLTPQELLLVEAFDLSGSAMSGLSWVEWVYLQERRFDDRQAVCSRVDAILARLSQLASSS